MYLYHIDHMAHSVIGQQPTLSMLEAITLSMPYSAPRACTKAGCNGLIRNGVCSNHGGLLAEKRRGVDARRGTAAERGYGGTWQRVRLMQLARQPLCQDCGAEGRVQMGVDVHHIKALRDGGTNSFDNLMTLCHSHHSQRTARGE